MGEASRVPRGGLRSGCCCWWAAPSMSAIILYIIVLQQLVDLSSAIDYRVEYTQVRLSQACKFMDSDSEEEWAITLNVASQKKCLVFYTYDTMPFASPIDPARPLWEAEFSASAGQTFRLGFEAWEKEAGGPMCEFENNDNRNAYLRWEEPLANLHQLAPSEQRPLAASREFTQSGYPCVVTIIGSVSRKPSPGAPRIVNATIEVLSGGVSPLKLTVHGYDLNPEPVEVPVLQVTGLNAECIASTLTTSDTQLTCLLTRLASAEVSQLQMAQVQVQTRLGMSRTASAAFPTCKPDCENGGACWWSKDFAKVECVCPPNYYGDACQHRYPDDEPILADIAPKGADFSLNAIQATVIAVSGRIWAADVPDTTVKSENCIVSRAKTSIELNAQGNTISDSALTVEVWRGPVTPYDKRPIAQADSLQISGLCIIPKGMLAFADKNEDTLTSQLTVSIEWARKFTNDTRESRDQLTFQLYGPLHLPSSIVAAKANEADGEMRVFREQSVRVSFCDAQGRPRLGGDDSDGFDLAFVDGPALQSQLGIRGGVARTFSFSDCLVNARNPECAYFEYKVSFDLAGTYLAHVLYFQPTALAYVGSPLELEVKGLGEVTVPVPELAESSISWADHLANRDTLGSFDTALAQTISPNTGAADRLNVLDTLLDGLQGRWFMERETVSLAFEAGLSRVDMGSVHVVRPQGFAAEPFFCDAHTDELDPGRVEQSLKPWHNLGNVPNKFVLSRMALSPVDCLASISVKAAVVHSLPRLVQVSLTRTGPASNDPRAKNHTSTVILKPFGAKTLNSGILKEWTSETVPELAANFVGRPALAEWVLSVEHQDGAGYVRDWWLDVTTHSCLDTPQEICGFGGGNLYGRADNVNDTVSLVCPAGGMISEIVLARYGRVEGHCEGDLKEVVVHGGCEADAEKVKQRVSTLCMGEASCELTATDIGVLGEEYLCADEHTQCLDGDDITRRRQRQPHEKKTGHEHDYARPRPYPGTEDFHLRATTVRHATEPFFRQRPAPRKAVGGWFNPWIPTEPTTPVNAVEPDVVDPCENEDVAPTPVPKRALIVKARCTDAKALAKFEDPEPSDKKMLVASVTADLDNDWKDETITAFAYEGGPLHVAFTYVGGNAFQPATFVVRNLVVGASGVPAVVGGQLELQAGDFNGDGYPELILGFIDHKSAQVRLFQWDLRIEDTSVWPAGIAKPNRADLSPCGCFDRESVLRQLFALAKAVIVPDSPTYDLTAPPTASSTRVDSPGFSYALAVGDIGLGFDVLVVSWVAGQHTVAWGVFQQTAYGVSLVGDVMALRDVDHAHAVSLALGDFEGTGSRELALGIVDWNTISVYFYTIDQTVSTFPMTMAKLLYVAEDSWTLNSNVNLRMLAGDLNDDLDDELVVGFTLGAEAHLFQVDAITCGQARCMELVSSSGYVVPTGRVPTTTTTRSPELKLAIGNVDESSTNELVVAVEYTSTTDQSVHKVMLVSLTAQSDSNQPFLINGRHCYAGPAYRESEDEQEVTVNNMALSVGNLYGLGYRVGEPTTVRFESVPELLAVVNAPPTHYDVIDGEEIAVNQRTMNGQGSFTKLTNLEGVTSSFEITRDTVAIESTASGKALDGKLAVVVGKLHQSASALKKKAQADGQGVLERLTVSRELTASGDDVVLYISTTRDQWKFPIVDQTGAAVGALDVWLSSSCGVECVQVADGRDLWWFAPDHEPFNVLTYSSRSPTDFVPSHRIMVGDRVTLGPNDHTQFVGESSGRSQNKATVDQHKLARDRATALGIDVNYEFMFSQAFLGLGPNHKLPLGINVNAMESEDHQTATEEASSGKASAAIDRDVSVQAYLEPINPEFAYRVQPFVWLARTADGHEYLKVEYTAEPGYHPGVATWWQRTYNRPDPAFNLPWWWAATYKRDRTMLTKELVATPQFPAMGELVHVTASVRNKALVSAAQVDVSFWRGNPDNCFDLECLTAGHTLIGSATIDFIPAQGKREVSFLMRYDGVQNIHVTLDDNEQLDEMHEDNNHAYALLFHNVREGGYTLQTLRLGRTDPARPLIDMVPRTNADGSFGGGYTVSATVLGDTFTRQNLVAQFWHGAVGVGGRLIATVSVPRLEGSVASTSTYGLSAYWHTASPDLHGHEQELHAVLLHSGFDPTPANIISHVSRRVSVACFGEIDLCGVCGGFNRSCAGCDGEPHSGVIVDACGVCGGDNSTCCVPRPGQAKLHRVRLTSDTLAGAGGGEDDLVKRVEVGELVVWENLLDWDVEIVAGLDLGSYDHLAAAFNLSALRDHDQAIPLNLPLAEDLPNFMQKYMATPAVKDHVDSASSDDEISIPLPDSTTQYLRRRITTVDGFVRVASVARTDYDGEEEVEERPAEFAMAGVCCAPEGEEEVEEAANQGGRPLRSVALSMLKEQRRRIDRLRAFTNSTVANNNLERVQQARDALRAVAADSAFYDPEVRETSAWDLGGGDTTVARRIRCLCPDWGGARRVKRIGEDPAMISPKGSVSVGPALNVGPGPARVGPSRSVGVGSSQNALRADLGLSKGRSAIEKMLSDHVTVDNALTVVDRAPTVIDQAPLIFDVTTNAFAAAGDMVANVASDPLTLITMIDPVTLVAAPAMIPLSMLDQQLAKWQAGAGDSAMQYAGATAGRVFVGALKVGIPLALTLAPLAVGVPVPPTALLSVIAPIVKQGVQLADSAAAHYGLPTLTDRAKGAMGYLMDGATGVGRAGVGLLMDGSAAVSAPARAGVGLLMDGAVSMSQALVPRSQRGNGTTTAYDDDHYDNDDDGYYAHDRLVSKRAEGTNAALKQALANRYGKFDFDKVANRPDGPSVLASGGASMPHRFFTPGVYLWHDARHPAVHGAIVVVPSSYAPDACGVCGGDNSACYVDCAGVADGLATLDDCGNCTGGTTGLEPNFFLNACGLCGIDGIDEEDNCTDVQTRSAFDEAAVMFPCAEAEVRDEQGVCCAPSDLDCAGVCDGKAVVDECDQCVLGSTGRAFNIAKDCAGQCFGNRSDSDPACTCAPGELDACFVCGGDNSSCRGCDGVLHSGAARDLCGVCGGDGSTCCRLAFAQVSVVVRGFEPLAPHRTLDAGETLAVTNLHAGYTYTFVLVRYTDHEATHMHSSSELAPLPPARTLRTVITQPGEYLLTARENTLATVRLSVRYNAKRLDACGHCVYPPTTTTGDEDHDNDGKRRHQLVAYAQCCEAMGPDVDVHAWFESTRLVDAANPTRTVRIIERTGHYRSAPTRHLLRLIAPHTIDARTWRTSGGDQQRLAVGDFIVLENRDLLDHMVTISGPQPLPDVVLERGTTVEVGPLLTPGTYQVVSNRNLVNTSFAVEFAFACTVHAPQLPAHQSPQAATTSATTEDQIRLMALLVLPVAGSFALAALVGLVAFIQTRRKAQHSACNWA